VSATVTAADYRTRRADARFAGQGPAQRHLTHFTPAFPSFSMRLVEIHERDGARERLWLECHAPGASKPAAARRTSSGKSDIS
jgi:hypothetical protein